MKYIEDNNLFPGDIYVHCNASGSLLTSYTETLNSRKESPEFENTSLMEHLVNKIKEGDKEDEEIYYTYLTVEEANEKLFEFLWNVSKADVKKLVDRVITFGKENSTLLDKKALVEKETKISQTRLARLRKKKPKITIKMVSESRICFTQVRKLPLEFL